MRWFKATRTNGDPNDEGEFVVEDNDGLEWQVRVAEVRTRINPYALCCVRPAVCLNRNYAATLELEQDLFAAVEKVLEDEAALPPLEQE